MATLKWKYTCQLFLKDLICSTLYTNANEQQPFPPSTLQCMHLHVTMLFLGHNESFFSKRKKRRRKKKMTQKKKAFNISFSQT